VAAALEPKLVAGHSPELAVDQRDKFVQSVPVTIT
jgi:hypothetical protein